MNLLDLFVAQRKLQFDCYPGFMRNNTVEQRLQDNLKQMIHEIIEVERETNFKHWKKRTLVDWDKVKEELVDVFIFFMNACNEVELSPAALIAMAFDKQNINRKRQKKGY